MGENAGLDAAGAIEALSSLNSGGESQGAGETIQQPVVQDSGLPAQQPVPQAQPTGTNPAWQPLLSQIPEILHEKVRPVLEQWDRGVQERFQQVQSQYSPYKQFADNRVDPTTLTSAWDLWNLMQNDPRRVYDTMAEHFKFSDQGPNGSVDEGEEFDLGGGPTEVNDPRIAQLQQQQEQILSMMQAAQQQEQERQGEQWLDTKIKTAQTQLSQMGIQPDEGAWKYILSTASAGAQNGDYDGAFDAAVQGYVALVNGIRQQPRAGDSAPTVLPTSGGTPSNRVNVSDFSERERRQYGVDLLKQALNG